jgi:hypothetical protein
MVFATGVERVARSPGHPVPASATTASSVEAADYVRLGISALRKSA